VARGWGKEDWKARVQGLRWTRRTSCIVPLRSAAQPGENSQELRITQLKAIKNKFQTFSSQKILNTWHDGKVKISLFKNRNILYPIDTYNYDLPKYIIFWQH
jgi:hypothetical protein